MTLSAELAPLFPDTAAADRRGHLTLGGVDAAALAEEFGTPLYVFCEATLRGRAAEFRREFARHYPDSLVLYAAKAFLNRVLARLLADEGLGLDVVSDGELAIAQAAAFPPARIYFHGNNKSRAELAQARAYGVGRIVVDGFAELSLLAQAGEPAEVLLRLSPNVDPHTHRYIATGLLDSKFGFPLATGAAEAALAQALASPNLRVRGLHVHLGSAIFETEPYTEAIGVVLRWAAEMKRRHGFVLEEFSPGGGFAVPYLPGQSAPPTGAYAAAIAAALRENCAALGLTLPRLVVEPGRAMVARAGVALYRAGAIKDIPGVRKYVALDGGMGDNIRPALYGARYHAVLAERMGERATETVALAGKFCESGDILIPEIALPPVAPGDLVAVPVSGAYQLPMASNYNASLRPAIVMVGEGRARLWRRRETYADLLALDEEG